jgi:hypothetical protein
MLNTLMKALPSLILWTIGGGAAFAANAPSDLCNGKNLDGWVQRGGKAQYAVEDGCIVGTSTLNTENSFLCTPRDYGDFILEYEFKVDPKLNSGVQIRSQCFATPTDSEWQGKKFKVPANRVHGYQIEIDPEPAKDRWWSAGIYEEAVRGWLFPGPLGGDAKAFTEQGRKIFKQGDWNSVRVEASGDSIKTTLNGSPCAAIKDGRVATGFIGLQVHGIGNDKTKDGTQVRWRKLRIQELAANVPSGSNTLSAAEKAAGWRLLWDGKTTDGWRSARSQEFPKGGWTIKNGELIVNETGGAEAAAGGDIITREKFSDFELQLDFKITPGANSGIKIFVDPGLNQGAGSSIGPEFQILDDAKHPDAKLGRDGNRTMGSLYDMMPAPANKKVRPVGEWNHAQIISKGKHVEFFLNGEKTVGFDRGSKAWRDTVAISKYKVWPAFGELAAGHILLQDHGNQVSFRNLKILVPAAK